MTPLLEALYRIQSAGGAEAFLLDLALKGTAVLITGFLAVLALRRATAATRHLAWCATFGALVLLPALVAWAPALELAVVPGVDSRSSDLGTGEPSPHAGTAPPWRAGEDLASSRGGAGSAGAATSGGPAAARIEGTSGSPWARAGRWLAAAYLAGALALLGYLALGALRARSLRSGARRLDGQPGWRELLDALRSLVGVRRPVTLEATDRVAVPLAWGARRPRIVLPARAGAWDEAQRREVLLHELAHVARHDWLSQSLARVGCALFWFHPLVWIAARRLILEAERACDDRVLAAGADSCDYADRLLRVAGGARRVADASYAAVAMARRSDLATRIEAILDGRVRRGTPGRPAAVLLVAVLLAPVAALGPARIARAEAPAGPAAAPAPEAAPEPRSAGGDRDLDRDLDRDGETDADRVSSRDRDGVTERTGRASRGSGGPLPPLLAAAGSGDLAEVRRLLAERGTDPEVGVAGRGTPLIRAAAGGHVEIVRELLDAGADPDGTEVAGDWSREVQRSPLGAAARGGHLEVARLLLDRGATVDLAPPGDATPLILAARHGHPEMAEMLLDSSGGGADPNRTVPGDGAPLIAAAAAGEVEVARALLDRGADPDVWVEGDESPLFHAVGNGDREMVRLLLERGADPDAEWPGDGNALIQAAGGGRDDLVELLLEAGAEVDRGAVGDGNPLIQAAARGDAGTVRALLARGADPDAAVEGDGNPLIAAAAGGHLEVLRLLVESGGDVDRIVPGDENPLIQAAANGHLEVVRYLLERGADPNVRVVIPPNRWRPDGEVRTPLSMARRGGHEAVVRLLLESGAVPEP